MPDGEHYPPIGGVEWVSLREHLESLRAADDRRYAEVNVEKEKALKIKETADLAALQLAREIQTYKDEKANELREQINNERSLYVTREDLASVVREIKAMIGPLTEFVTAQRGVSNRRQIDNPIIVQVIIALITIGTVVAYLVKK
jgi:hypothetical protein